MTNKLVDMSSNTPGKARFVAPKRIQNIQRKMFHTYSKFRTVLILFKILTFIFPMIIFSSLFNSCSLDYAHHQFLYQDNINMQDQCIIGGGGGILWHTDFWKYRKQKHTSKSNNVMRTMTGVKFHRDPMLGIIKKEQEGMVILFWNSIWKVC